eukprot:5625519-Pleurochrysis_carterae.AAC.3
MCTRNGVPYRVASHCMPKAPNHHQRWLTSSAAERDALVRDMQNVLSQNGNASPCMFVALTAMTSHEDIDVLIHLICGSWIEEGR